MKYIIEKYLNLFDLIKIEAKNYHITLTDHGAGIIDLKTYDKDNNLSSIALGYDDLKLFYKDDDYYFGKTIGRIAGRIENGTYSLNDKIYNLEINDKKLNSNLHSGTNSISFQNFEYNIIANDKIKVIFTIFERKSDFIAPMKYKVVYTLDEDSFTIENYAYSTIDTICNMTNHVYFNLSGDFKSNILDHEVQMDGLIYKDGNTLKYINEVFDFTKPKKFKTHIDDLSLEATKGYDHYFKFNKNKTVKVTEPNSKRYLEVSGNSNGVVIYTGGYFHGRKSQANTEYKIHDGFTLEFQNMPNGINTEYLDEKSILKANSTFYQIIKYKFGVDK